MYKKQAFTIIELMFVIAVIGVMASLGINLLRQDTEFTKTKKTALQIQQILQAGMAYYVDKQFWPLICAGGGPTADFMAYLPITVKNGSVIRPQPNAYGDDYRCGKTSNGKSFYVTTTVPNNNIAKRIVSQLPNAKTQGPSNSEVYSAVTIPGEIPKTGYVYSVGTETVYANDNGAHGFPTSCLPGYEPKINANLQRIQVDADCKTDGSKCDITTWTDNHTLNNVGAITSDANVISMCNANAKPPYCYYWLKRLIYKAYDDDKRDKKFHFEWRNAKTLVRIGYEIYCLPVK